MSIGLLTFISTGGGPFIVLGSNDLRGWEGCDPPSGGRIVEATFRWRDAKDPATDYDRACDVQGYLGVLDACTGIGTGDALVIGEESHIGLWKPYQESQLVFVGGASNKSDEAISIDLSILTGAEMTTLPWLETPVEFTVTSNLLYAFDSAYAGAEVAGVTMPDDYLTFELSPGKYHVGCSLFNPDPDTQLHLYRFEAV